MNRFIHAANWALACPGAAALLLLQLGPGHAPRDRLDRAAQERMAQFQW